jgi:hypothetical protein
MNLRASIAALVTGLVLAGPAEAHRASGLLQASLVEVLPSQVGVEVTLVLGMDVASKIVAMVDANGDGALSEVECSAWATQFLKAQEVSVDGHALPLKLAGVRTTAKDAVTREGHAEIVVNFTADLGEFASGRRSILCANRYEPIPSAHQCNGLMPKSPDVRVFSHARGENEKALTLAVEFPNRPAPAPNPAKAAPHPDGPAVDHPSESMVWITSLSLAVSAGAALVERRRRSSGSTTALTAGRS